MEGHCLITYGDEFFNTMDKMDRCESSSGFGGNTVGPMWWENYVVPIGFVVVDHTL